MKDHSALAAKLDSVFHPQSIAVVGASTRPGTVGNDIFRNLLFAEFNGSVYPVNPEGQVDLRRSRLRHRWPRFPVRHRSGRADRSLRGRSRRGRRGDRQGREGAGGDLGRLQGGRPRRARRLEAKLRDKVRAAGIPLIGPNCLGVINTDPTVSMNAAFGRKMPDAGNLAFLSQSGALCTSVLDYAEERQMGFSKFISFGNKADVNEIDLLGLPGQGREDLGDRHVPGRRDQRPAVHRDGRRHLLGNAQADALPEVGPLARRGQGRQQPHRLAGRLRLGLRRPAGAKRRAAGRHDRRVVRLRRPLHHAAAAARQPRGHHHQRRRAGHHGHRRRRAPRPETGRAERGHQGEAQAVAARHRLAAQSGRRDRRRPRRPLQGRACAPCWKTRTSTWAS